MTQRKIDEAALMYNKTKDRKYKYLWYELIKETYGPNNINGWNVSSSASDQGDDEKHIITRSSSCGLL